MKRRLLAIWPSPRFWPGVSLMVALLATACFRGKLPPRELYRLRLPENADSSPAQDPGIRAVAPGTVAIAPYIAPGIYGSRAIVYRVGETQYGAYASREWALPVSTMLGVLTEEIMRTRPLTTERALFDPASLHGYTYIWRGSVRELEEIDRGRNVYAAVRLDARLLRAADDSVLWSGSVRVERAVPEGTMPTIVMVLSQITAEAISQLIDDAREAIAVPAASAVRSVPATPLRRP